MLSPIVKVIVGPQKVTFDVHSGLLREKSDYFRACLQGNFSEALKGEVRLPETKPEAFQYYAKLLYTGDLAPFNFDIDKDIIFRSMIDVYALGDRLLCHGIQNRSIDMVQEICVISDLSIGRIFYAAKIIEPRSKLMQFLIEKLAFDMASEGYATFVEDPKWLEFIQIDGRITTELICKQEERWNAVRGDKK